jgi:hypothetical protein
MKVRTGGSVKAELSREAREMADVIRGIAAAGNLNGFTTQIFEFGQKAQHLPTAHFVASRMCHDRHPACGLEPA